MKAAPPLPGPLRPFVPPVFAGTALSNGLSVRAARWGSRPTVAATFLIPGAGNVSDSTGLEGLAEITAESFLGGTARRTARELAEAIDDLAAVLDVSSGFDGAIARLFVLEKDLDAGLDLFREVLTEPSFPEDEVDRARRRAIDTLTEQRSEPSFLARERLLDRLYPAHPYGRVAATERGLGALTREDVASFHRSRYPLYGATLVLAGAAAPERLLEAAERAFGTLPPGGADGLSEVPPPPVIGGFSIHLVNRPGSVQTNLLFARPALRRADARFPAASVANQALGGGASSRLFHVLREERGLTYGAYSALAPRLRAGHFGASIDCRTSVTEEALRGLLEEIRRFAAEGPDEDELARARSYLVGSFALGRETPGAVGGDEVTRVLHGLPEDEWATWRDRLAAVGRDEASEAARTLFDPTVGIVAAVGDAAVLRPVLEKLGETTLWDADGPRS